MSYLGHTQPSEKIDSADILDGSILPVAINPAPTFPNAVVAHNMASQFAFKNRVLNGNFDFWERGTSQTATGYGSADRWRLVRNVTTSTMSRVAFTAGQTDVPHEPAYHMRNVVVSSAGAASYAFNRHVLGSIRTLAGKPVTLTFWAKANAVKNISVEWSSYTGNTAGVGAATTTGMYATKYALSTAWQLITMTVTLPIPASVGSDGDDSISFNIWYDAGSNYSNRTNALGQQSGTFDIAQVQLEEGTVATPFEMKPFAIEYMLLQQYYQKIAFTRSPVFMTSGGTAVGGRLYYPVAMIGTPTVTISTATWTSSLTLSGSTTGDLASLAATTATMTVSAADIMATSLGISGINGQYAATTIWGGTATVSIALEYELSGV
jgi:hypothetical protein